MDREEEWRPVVAGHSSVNVITVCNHHPIGHLHSLGGAAVSVYKVVPQFLCSLNIACYDDVVTIIWTSVVLLRPLLLPLDNPSLLSRLPSSSLEFLSVCI